MKKSFLLIAILCLLRFQLAAQSTNYSAFYLQISKHFTDFDEFNQDIDTINKSGATYSKLYSHFTYGIGVVIKRGYLETGGHLYWGEAKEIFSSTQDTVGSSIVLTDWWVRQRLFSLNYRIGLSLGNNFTLGTDLGGIISNFQHLKLNSDKTPLWFINFSGQRSFLGSVSPYMSIHLLYE
jgi:hypothetical protein